MFARITRYRMKADRIDAARAALDRVKGEIMALPGLKRFVNVIAEDGSGYVISLVDSRELSELNAAKVRAIWSRFADYLEVAPDTESFAVTADWSN